VQVARGGVGRAAPAFAALSAASSPGMLRFPGTCSAPGSVYGRLRSIYS
jgi:hypothetical protein